jgi:integrase
MLGRDLVAKVTGSNSCILFESFLDQFENKIMVENDLAEATTREYKNRLVHVRKHLGKKPIDEISVKEIADFMDLFPPKTSNKYRKFLMLVFKYAIGKGLCHDNPAEKTLACKTSKSRTRLSLEGFVAIYEKAEQWLKNAMDIALQTLQRREDIVNIKRTDNKDGYLYVIQSKTKKHGEAAYLRIKVEEPLKEVINRCRDDLLSPYLIHRKPDRAHKQNYKAKSKKHYTQVTPGYLTKAFAEIRDQLELFKNIEKKKLPTFHEIRSLGIKLYEDQGIDAQELAGHKNRAMTDKYKEGHDISWTDVKAGLRFTLPTSITSKQA